MCAEKKIVLQGKEPNLMEYTVMNEAENGSQMGFKEQKKTTRMLVAKTK